MDPISTGVPVKSASAEKISGDVRETPPESLPKDRFLRTTETEIFTKPIPEVSHVISPRNTLTILGNAAPTTLSAVSSAGGPMPLSIPGAIAKWLINDEQEMQLGEAIARQVESDFPISHDPALIARVENLGRRIAANSKRPNLRYSFKVIDDNTVNAFACPGGKIYVHRGLLERFPKDSHLTFIVGHEMGHVENRDSIDRLGIQLVLGIIQVILNQTRGNLDDLVALAAGKLYDSQISQKTEYAADRRGIEHLKMLGHDPREGAAALRGLEVASRKDPNLLERLFSTHPPTKDRIKKAEEYAAKL